MRQPLVRVVSALVLVIAVASTLGAAVGETEESAWEQLLDQASSMGIPPDEASAQLVLGHVALESGELNLASALFAVASDSAAADAYANWTGALVQKMPESHYAHFLRGDALGRLGVFDESIAALGVALALKPDFVAALNARGVIHSIAGDRGEAWANWVTVRDLDPAFADMHANLVVYMMEGGGRTDAAEEELRTALELAPSFGMAHNSRACILASQGHFEEARDVLVQADSLSGGASPYIATNSARLVPLLDDAGRLSAVASRADTAGADSQRGTFQATWSQSLDSADLTLGLKFGDYDVLEIAKLSIVNFKNDLVLGLDKLRGGVYLVPSSAVAIGPGAPPRFITNYLLGYPRDLTEGSLN